MGKLIKKIKKRSVLLDVFENSATVEGKEEMMLAIKITRSYFDKGHWCNVPHYREKDIADIKEAIEEYEKWKEGYGK